MVKEAVTLFKQMRPELRAEYNQIYILIKIPLVSAASSVEAEPSFSTLRRLKTWLRTAMSEILLNTIVICYVHRDDIDNIDLMLLMREFISRSDYTKLTFHIICVVHLTYVYIHISFSMHMYVCVCVCVCVRARARASVCECV